VACSPCPDCAVRGSTPNLQNHPSHDACLAAISKVDPALALTPSGGGAGAHEPAQRAKKVTQVSGSMTKADTLETLRANAAADEAKKEDTAQKKAEAAEKKNKAAEDKLARQQERAAQRAAKAQAAEEAAAAKRAAQEVSQQAPLAAAAVTSPPPRAPYPGRGQAPAPRQ